MSEQPGEPRYGKRIPQNEFDELMKTMNVDDGSFMQREGETEDEFADRVEAKMREAFGANVHFERVSSKEMRKMQRGSFSDLPTPSKVTAVAVMGIFFGLLATLLVGAGALLWWVIQLVFGL